MPFAAFSSESTEFTIKLDSELIIFSTAISEFLLMSITGESAESLLVIVVVKIHGLPTPNLLLPTSASPLGIILFSPLLINIGVEVFPSSINSFFIVVRSNEIEFCEQFIREK